MSSINPLSISDITLRALSAINAYRYLTVIQVATITGVNAKSASEMLLRLERHGLLDHFGNVGIRGYGKTPKVYFLTRRGHAVLSEELEALGQPVQPYRQINISTRWSPLMYHRLATLDVLSYIERDCVELSAYELLGTLVEYRREKIGTRWRKETTDYVAAGANPSDKIIPDAGFALQHRKSGRQALFLIEVDRGTERLTTTQSDAEIATFTGKLAQYDRYLASGRAEDRFPQLGQFAGFHVLVVTTSDARIENMRRAAQTLPANFHHLYRFSTLERVSQNFLHDGWLNRDHADQTSHQLIKGN
ncbi:MAG: replication-relaxation family protein [Pseudomonadota bacterium]